MKTTVTLSDFRDAFNTYNRKDSFSYEGYEALYNNLLEYEDSCDTEMELDVIALCCDFTEYEDMEELKGNYWDIESMDDLQDHTIVIPIEGTDRFIIQDY